MNPIKYTIGDKSYELNPIGGDDITAHDIHVMYVYDDPDFIADLAKLEDEHGSDIEQAIIRTGSTKSDDVYAYFSPLANEWRITEPEVANAYNGTHIGNRLVRESNEQPMLVDWSGLYNEQHFTVDFNIDKLRKDHLEELWRIVAERKSKLSKGKLKRNRTPENDKLIYAIFKARKQGQTFTQIYLDYESGNLNGYTGNGATLGSSDELAHYYRRHEP